MKGKQSLAEKGPMIICLAGFSGSGKSTLLKNWQSAATADWDFKDLDDIVAARLLEDFGEGEVPLGKIIEQHGWEVFRTAELECLRNEIKEHSDNKHLALALGGGTLEQGLPIIQEYDHAFLIGLDVDFEICWQRIQADKNRPLVAKGKDFMRQKFQQRRPFLLESDLILGENDLRTGPQLEDLIDSLYKAKTSISS